LWTASTERMLIQLWFLCSLHDNNASAPLAGVRVEVARILRGTWRGGGMARVSYPANDVQVA